MRKLASILVLAILVLTAGYTYAEEVAPLTPTQIAELVMPSVVQVVVKVTYEIRPLAWYESELKEDKWIREEGTWKKEEATIMGSGWVAFSGLPPGEEKPVTIIGTNWHVISAFLESRYSVQKQYKAGDYELKDYRYVLMEDARPYAETRIQKAELGLVVIPGQQGLIPAKVEWSDEELDVALLRVDGVEGIPTVQWGDSDALRVGDTIYTAGAPLGLPFAFYKGSLAQKNLDVGPGWQNMWRYDMASQPGSSGSAIFNERGQVVAIVRGSFVASWLVPVGLEGQRLAIALNNMKFLLRWQGYGYLFAGDPTDIIEQWQQRKFGE